jgi:hypothetical protein
MDPMNKTEVPRDPMIRVDDTIWYNTETTEISRSRDPLMAPQCPRSLFCYGKINLTTSRDAVEALNKAIALRSRNPAIDNKHFIDTMTAIISLTGLISEVIQFPHPATTNLTTFIVGADPLDHSKECAILQSRCLRLAITKLTTFIVGAELLMWAVPLDHSKEYTMLQSRCLLYDYE